MVAVRLLFLLALICASVNGIAVRDPREPQPEDCVCVKPYGPVCGVDGKTYGSTCSASCAGVSAECTGECPCTGGDVCACPENYEPVCGTDGETYNNEACATCSKVDVECKGECPCKKPCICTKEYAPVCSASGTTYGNKCEAGCDNAKIACEGECPCTDECLAPFIRCGSNPCDSASCPAYPTAECKPDYCKGCNAVDFFVGGKKVNCEEPVNCICTLQYDPVCGVDGETYGNACGARCAGVSVACEGECPCKSKCDGQIFNCVVDPCQYATCRAYPTATCVSNYCNGCSADFYVDGQLVDCVSGPKCIKEGRQCRLSRADMLIGNSRGDCCDNLDCCSPCPAFPPEPVLTPVQRTCEKECRVCIG